jgi:hypothetical protein
MNNDNAALLEALRKQTNAVVQLNREAAKKREAAKRLMQKWSAS